MAAVIACEVRDGETVAVGTLSPIPAAGVLLARARHAPRAAVIIINHEDYWPFHNGSKEFYDFAQRGKLDLFFLSGGQIDQFGNLNLIAIGDHDHPAIRLPGGAGNTTHGQGVKRGAGFAVGFKNICYSEGFDDSCAARVIVRDGSAEIHCAAAEVGQGNPGVNIQARAKVDPGQLYLGNPEQLSLQRG